METNEKDLIENNTPLCNWNASKGDPYTYSGCGMKSIRTPVIGDIKLEILGDEITEEYSEGEYSLKFNNNLKRIESFEFEHTKEIACVDETGRLVLYPNTSQLDLTKPVSVVLSYPFSKFVKATINPSYTEIIWEDNPEPQRVDATHIGCLVWQIAKAYGIIYKTMDNEVGIWGHGFSDLYLERITVLKDNKINIGIGS